MRQFRQWLCLLVLVGAATAPALAGCGREGRNEAQAADEPVRIPIIFNVDPNTGERENEALVEAFNEAYQGRYYVEVKWILETEEEYRQNLKRLNVTDSLPAVITDLRMLPSLYQTMIADGRIVDLKPYIEADSAWQAAIEPETLRACSGADGSVYLMTGGTGVFTCSGMYWNEELFRQAGIEAFPATWEEFWEACEQLKSSGITPLALHTEGTAWAPMLIATAKLAGEPGGYAFMQENLPESYQNAAGEELARTLMRLFEYTTDNAFHTDFDAAYLNFFSGKTAMLPNGYWMLADIAPEWQAQVRFSPFPGNVLISSPETFGWAVTDCYSEEVKQGAVEFLKFRTLRGQQEKAEFLKDGVAGITGDPHPYKAGNDYKAAFLSDPLFVPNYQVKWNSILQEKTLGQYLPLLVNGEIGVTEFLQAQDQSIEAYNREQNR